MQYDCLSFREIPHSSRLFLDYLDESPSLAPFYAAPQVLAAPVAHQTPEHRAKVADVLDRQNRSFGASAKTLSNIERLRGGANAIVTGQQAGLFGGPLLSIFKAVAAIKLAAQHNAVPVFWIATTDHDLPEIDHAKVICDGKLTRISARLEAQSGAMVSRSVIASDAVAEFTRCYPQADPETLALLADCYREGERTGIAFARLWAKLFADFGLVLIDPDDADLQRISAPLYVAAAESALELNQSLTQRATELKNAGYHEQVLVTESTSLLFVDVNGARTPVRIHRELTGEAKFRADALQWSDATELAQWIAQNPDRVTPNALLRPVNQDFLLPTLAYIGGPAEIAYFGQSTVLYDRLLGGRTPILPRASATLIEPRIGQFLERYDVRLQDLLNIHCEQDFALSLAEQKLPGDVKERFAAAQERVSLEFERLREIIRQEDKTLEGAAEDAFRKIEYQLEKLEERTARARMRREGEIARHAEILWNNLRPEHQLQEREIAGAHFLLKYGTGFVHTVATKLNPSCTGHQILPI